MQAIFKHRGDAIDHTPASDVAAGQVVVQNELVGVAPVPIAANKLGALQVSGVHSVVKATGAIDAGELVYWDADGNPVNGTAGSGAATATSTDNALMGKCVADAASGDERVLVRLDQ